MTQIYVFEKCTENKMPIEMQGSNYTLIFKDCVRAEIPEDRMTDNTEEELAKDGWVLAEVKEE